MANLASNATETKKITGKAFNLRKYPLFLYPHLVIS